MSGPPSEVTLSILMFILLPGFLGCLLPRVAAGQTFDFERDSLLVDLPYPNLLNILSARVPGLQLSPVDCAEGDMSAKMTLRGMNQVPGSKSKNNQQRNAPLIVVDGLIWYGSISDINTVDVAKVEILRDASALYGARARNGAILITTRQGNRAMPTFRTLRLGLCLRFWCPGASRLIFAGGNSWIFSSESVFLQRKSLLL